MPTYMCYAHKDEINAKQKLEIAAGIARIHSQSLTAGSATNHSPRTTRPASAPAAPNRTVHFVIGGIPKAVVAQTVREHSVVNLT
jgi:hypothetical protein